MAEKRKAVRAAAAEKRKARRAKAAEKRKAVRAKAAEKRKAVRAEAEEKRKARRAEAEEKRKAMRAEAAEKKKAMRATRREAAKAALVPVTERGLTSSDTLPILRSNRLAALQATPPGAERFETIDAQFVNKRIEEFISTGWKVVESSSSRSSFFFNGTNVVVHFRKE